MNPNLTLAYGEILWDILPTATVLGGAPFNFAYRLHSLGVPALPVSRLGREVLGVRAAREIHELGLDTTLVQWDAARPTGTVQVTFDAAGQPDYVIVPGVAYDHIELTPALRASAARAGCICFGTLIQRAPISRATLAAVLEAAPRALKLLDINLRKLCHTPETVRFSLGHADVLKLNDGEIHAVKEMLGLPGQTMIAWAEALLRGWSLRTVVVTLGERGALAVDRSGQMVYSPGHRIEMVDPLGSGDAFTAAFAEALLRGAGLREACERGNALGALVAATKGGTVPVAKNRIDELLQSGAARQIDGTLAWLIE